MDKEIIRTTKVAIFHNKKIRKTIYRNEWWFSIIDIVEVLTESDRPRKYWSDLKKKLVNEGYSEVSEKIGQLKLEELDGKKSSARTLLFPTKLPAETRLIHGRRFAPPRQVATG